MALQRLDVLALLVMTGSGFKRRGGGATGYIKATHLAHLVPNPDERWTISPDLPLDELASQDFLDLAEGLEEEFRREFRARQVDTNHDQVLIVGLLTSDQD
jgi:GTP-binding protein HflX